MKKILLSLFCAIFIFTKANAAIKVTPTVIEMDTKNAKSNYVTSSFNVQGGENETIRFKIYPEYFKITSNGTMDMLEKTNACDSLINNIKFVPSEFTLQNGRSKIRYSGKTQIIKGRTLIDEKPVNNNVVGAKNFLFANEILPTDKITQDGEYKIRLILNYKDENGKIKNLIKESTINITKGKQTAI